MRKVMKSPVSGVAVWSRQLHVFVAGPSGFSKRLAATAECHREDLGRYHRYNPKAENPTPRSLTLYRIALVEERGTALILGS
jgi:hypothetical protein